MSGARPLDRICTGLSICKHVGAGLGACLGEKAIDTELETILVEEDESGEGSCDGPWM